jgi:large subunit ribosomal protein L15
MERKKRKKIVKMRGSRTCGKGGIQPGGRGGRGYSGSKKHRKSWILKNEPEHLGKKGFVSKTREEFRTVNLRDLEKLAGDKKEIVLKDLGYDKVLGSGKLSKALIVKAMAFSKRAKERIEKAGGKAIEI